MRGVFHKITWSEFVTTFVPFALLLAAALLLPEQTDNVVLNRVIFTIWLSTVLLIPGLCLYVVRGNSRARASHALLLITFAYLAYMVHFYFATFQVFGGIKAIFTHMRPLIAWTNIVLTVWWTLDTLVAWLAPAENRLVRVARAVFLAFLFAIFVVTDLFLRPGVIRYLGIVLAVSVVGCLIVRNQRRAVLAESRPVAKPQLGFVFLLTLVLLAVAYGAAEVRPLLDPSGVAAAGASGVEHAAFAHTVMYYRVIYTIWAAIVLLTPALCFYIFLRPTTPPGYWIGFWTASYLAYMCHFYWTVFGTFEGNIAEILHSSEGVATNPEKVVCHPIPDFVLTVWWGVDVLLAWLVAANRKWIHVQRGAVHLLAFAMFFGAFVLAPKASAVAHAVGILMALTVSMALLVRLVVRESDPNSLLMVLYVKTFQFVNLFVPWHALPTWLAIFNLGALREVLRARNLHNTSDVPTTRPAGFQPPLAFTTADRAARNSDGLYNDLAKPMMGSASTNPNDPTNSSDFTRSNPGARFGRNIPLSEVDPERDGPLMEPSPRKVSDELLARPAGGFVPASTLNLLAAAWIQFQTHDWFNHGNPLKGQELEVALEAGDDWPDNPMLVRRTRPDPTRLANDGIRPKTFANAESHWWDGSQIYGSSLSAVTALLEIVNGKPTGKLRMDKNGLLSIEPHDLQQRGVVEQTGLMANWWLGLSLLHNLFSREHNAICDHLRAEFPEWDGMEIYRVARLVNTALMAKIHTVDWTPAILGHPALQIGMRANWWGLATEHIKKAFDRISDSEAISGIPGSATNHHGSDYCLTEEFVSVYRLHPLMPDDIKLCSAVDGHQLAELKLGAEPANGPDDVVGPDARDHTLQFGTMADAFYSFGIASPGAVRLHNFPQWMRRVRRRTNGALDELIDLATIDVLRDRERGVPRYNRFRELFHLPRVTSFEEFVAEPAWADELRRVYGDVDRVDLMVGMYAEQPPPGFGFSDTAFRVFILMASRRLKSDRFFTRDYTPAVYSQPGLDWIESNDMASVLLRHYPSLTPFVQGVKNVFAPWNKHG